MQTLLPESVSLELCKMAKVDPTLGFNKLSGQSRDKLIKLLAGTFPHHQPDTTASKWQ